MDGIEQQSLENGARIVVAMSGGVDSSTTAALMVEAGYEVIGVTLQLYDHGEATGRKGACCAGQDIYDARRVAETLDIPHYVLDYESRFREKVIDEFADSYLRGDTPIPCVRCNQTVKFRDLLTTAKDLGAERLVTGHYVQRIDGPEGAEMYRARDSKKDQSYFLFTTTGDQLGFLEFPLGAMSKSETRDHAARFQLPVAEKPESQDICFVPNGNYASVVEKLRPGSLEPGNIVDLDGNVIGRHDGIINFTVGQRRGMGVAAAHPLYVVKVDPETHTVVAGPKEALHRHTIFANEINWIGASAAQVDGRKFGVKIRSTTEPEAATITDKGDGRIKIDFDVPQAGVSSGQAAVIYDGERVLGGGWIERES